jgi:hypothetical protein
MTVFVLCVCVTLQLEFECASFAPSTHPSHPSSSLPGVRQHADQSAIGCAIFVNTRKLEVLRARRVVLGGMFCEPLLLRSQCPRFSREVRGKGHSLSLVQLRLRSTGQTLVVVRACLFCACCAPRCA